MSQHASGKIDLGGIDPADDLVHEPKPQATWRESYHFGFGDPTTGSFGYATFGKRPTKGRSGFLIAWWDPTEGFLVGQDIDTFERHDDVHEVAGLSMTCVKPFEEWQVRFEGSLVRAPRIGERRYEEARGVLPAERIEVPVTFEFTWRALAPPHEYTWRPTFGALFDGRHEQPGSCDGLLTIGHREIVMDGWNGIRDHAWGTRDWFGPARGRWISSTFESPPHLSLLFTELADGSSVVDGGLYDDDGVVPIVSYTEQVTEMPSEGKPEPVSALFTVTDANGRSVDVEATVSAMLPIRFRPPDPTVPVSWNDRAVMTFSAAHGSGIGEMEFMAAIDETESKEVDA